MIILIILCAPLLFACGSNVIRAIGDNTQDIYGKKTSYEKDLNLVSGFIREGNQKIPADIVNLTCNFLHEASVDRKDFSNILVFLRNKTHTSTTKYDTELHKYFSDIYSAISRDVWQDKIYRHTIAYNKYINNASSYFSRDFMDFAKTAVQKKSRQWTIPNRYYNESNEKIDYGILCMVHNIQNAIKKLESQQQNQRLPNATHTKTRRSRKNQQSNSHIDDSKQKEYITNLHNALNYTQEYIDMYSEARATMINAMATYEIFNKTKEVCRAIEGYCSKRVFKRFDRNLSRSILLPSPVAHILFYPLKHIPDSKIHESGVTRPALKNIVGTSRQYKTSQYYAYIEWLIIEKKYDMPESEDFSIQYITTLQQSIQNKETWIKLYKQYEYSESKYYYSKKEISDQNWQQYKQEFLDTIDNLKKDIELYIEARKYFETVKEKFLKNAAEFIEAIKLTTQKQRQIYDYVVWQEQNADIGWLSGSDDKFLKDCEKKSFLILYESIISAYDALQNKQNTNPNQSK